jgi:hypothetical protein
MRTSRVSLLSASLLGAGLLLVGCKPAAQAGDAAAATASASAATPATTATAAAAAATVPDGAAVTPTASIEAGFSEGMPYATVRKRLVDAGWLPLRDPECWKNAGQGSTVCGLLPEVESCSGDGYCNMHFANADTGQRIAITTYGPYERWNQPGQESALAVKSWEVTPIAAPTAATCPSQDFDAFLKAFASDAKIEQAFTAPVVKVAELGGGEDGDDTVMVYEEGAKYDAFVLRFRDGKWILKPQPDLEGRVIPADVAVKPEDNGAYYVTLPGNVEGISYRFERRNDCWQLTSDPDVVP